MRKNFKSALGVTLLEIMLVLAIAAMIIVMSIRYYQSANTSQQMNSFLQQLQGITATVESLTLGTGGYISISSATLQKMLPGGSSALVAPWGGTMSYTAADNGFTLNLPVKPSENACTLLSNQLKTNNHYVMASDCSTVQYISNP